MKKGIVVCMLLAIAMQACLRSEDPNKEIQELLEKQDFKISQHLKENNITAEEKDANGVYRVALKENPSGEAIEFGDVAVVDYTITLLDGTLVGQAEESTRLGYLNPAQNRIEDRYLPTALFVGLSYMRQGETYRFYVPFNLAYGSQDLSELLPKQSIIVLEMEVKELYKTRDVLLAADLDSIDNVIEANEELQISDTLSGNIRKALLTEGEGETPDAGDKVSLIYSGRFLDGTEFDSNTKPDQPLFLFTIGEGKTIPGFETAVESMKKGEKAIFYLPSDQGYGEAGAYLAPKAVRAKFNAKIPPHSPLVFEIELKDLTKG